MPLYLHMISLGAVPPSGTPILRDEWFIDPAMFPSGTGTVRASFVGNVSAVSTSDPIIAKLYTSPTWQDPTTSPAVTGTILATFPSLAAAAGAFSAAVSFTKPTAATWWKFTLEVASGSATVDIASLVLSGVAAPGSTGATKRGGKDPYGVDIWFDLSAADGPNTVVDQTGDWLLVRGIEALRQSLIRRIITAPGDWRTKPDYGAGARLYVRKRNNKAARDELANRIRAQCLKDRRVLKCESVIVDSANGMLRIRVKVVSRFQPVGSQGVLVSIGLPA